MTSDGRSLRIGVSDLRRHPGERTTVIREVDLDSVAVSTAEVPSGQPGRLDVVLESLTDGVTLTGTLEVPWHGPCRRCLEDTSGVATVELREVFSDKAPATGGSEGDGDLLPIDGDVVDLAPVVHDAAVLAMPIAPLCREDCPGPDPEHFPVSTGDGEHRRSDPRWSALDELRFDPAPDDRLE